MSRRTVVTGIVIATAGLAAAILAVLAASSARRGDVERKAIGSESIVMIGDSITEQVPWSTVLGSWPVVNRGFDGFTSAELVPVAETAAAAGPRAAFILTGTNDIRDSRRSSWTVEHLAAMLDAFARESSETTVVVQTLLPRADRAREVMATNAAIRRLAAERGVGLLDLHPEFDDGTGALRPGDTTDGVHLGDTGHARWAALLEDAFATLPT